MKFSSAKYLKEIIEKNRKGVPIGAFSICSANSYVIEAGLIDSSKTDSNILIESTCNQVNQDGGYIGMTPKGFANYVSSICESINFPKERVLLGGDHLGPYPWRHKTSSYAMNKAKKLVIDYVAAGYQKIHLDTSMPCTDDKKENGFTIKEQAIRAAELCVVAEETWGYRKGNPPVYVIGSEVPAPGGVESNKVELQITKPEVVRETIEIYKDVFKRKHLLDAWERVIGLVVQPGVEFTSSNIFRYEREKALPLSACLETIEGIVYEAHSTDYQLPNKLRQMVEDHFCILKVGPALTFAYREAIFSLFEMEKLLYRDESNLSNLIDVTIQVMKNSPKYWKDYYKAKDQNSIVEMLFSYSDRIRYYWSFEKIQDALKKLLINLEEVHIPESLISQYLPNQYEHIREGMINNKPKSLILDHICDVIKNYHYACD